MNWLAKNPTGRMMLHVMAMCSCMNHFHCPHCKFFISALMRYIKGEG